MKSTGSTSVLAAALALWTATAISAAVQAPAQMPLRTFTPEEIATMAASLPAGEGRELTVRVCAACHEPQRAASVRLTREGWQEVVTKMIGLGARASEEEFAQVTDYLATHFKGEASKPINLNSAPAVDLEAVAGLLRKEAAAWIAYRNKNGPCGKLEDLKKVPGVPYKKIDDRKDRLVCF